MSALRNQVGGTHYSRLKIQPLSLSYLIAKGDSCFTLVAKYITRDKTNRTEDLKKAIHSIQLREVVNPDYKTPIDTGNESPLLIEFAEQFENSEFIYDVLGLFHNGCEQEAIQTIKAELNETSAIK